MAQYIDKFAALSKLDDWRDKIKMYVCTTRLDGRQKADAAFEYEILGKVRDFLDRLEVKEANLDFAKEVDKWVRDNGDTNGFFNVQDLAEHFFKLGMIASNKPQKTE